MASTAPTAERFDFAQLVREHPGRGALGALCCDVLERQSRASSDGTPTRKQVKARARALSVQHRDAATAAGNLLDALCHAGSADERDELVGAFVAWGLGQRLEPGHETDELALEAFVAWLARQPRYAVFAHAAQLLPRPAQVRLAEVLQEACIHAEERSRSDAVVLLEALALLDPAGTHLDALATVLDDPVVEAAADAFAGRRESAPVPAPSYRGHVEGTWVSAAGTGPWRVIGWLTGWALLRRLGSLGAWLLRWQCHARVALDGRVVRVERWREVLGREVYVIDESLRADEVRAVVRVLRRPLVVTLIGTLCLLAGLTGFGVALHVVLREGGFVPLAWGLFALGLGAGCDLLLDYAVRSRGGRVWLEITAPGRPPLRVAGVQPEAAAELARALERIS